jgi:hypothetical protein
MRLVTYRERVERAREALATSEHPNGQPDAMTGEMAELDRIYVAGASLRSRDPEIIRLRRQVSNRSASGALDWTDDEDGAT